MCLATGNCGVAGQTQFTVLFNNTRISGCYAAFIKNKNKNGKNKIGPKYKVQQKLGQKNFLVRNFFGVNKKFGRKKHLGFF